MLCPKCNTDVKEGLKFCTECGARVGKTICLQCKAEVEADMRFCGYCGTRVGQQGNVPQTHNATEQPYLNKTQPKKNKPALTTQATPIHGVEPAKARKPISRAAKMDFSMAIIYLVFFVVGLFIFQNVVVNSVSGGANVRITNYLLDFIVSFIFPAALIVLGYCFVFVMHSRMRYLIFIGLAAVASIVTNIWEILMLEEDFYRVFLQSYFVLIFVWSFVSPSDASRGLGKLSRILVSIPLLLLAVYCALMLFTPYSAMADAKEFRPELLIGWLICAVPHLISTFRSREFKEQRAEAREQRQGMEMGGRILSFLWFWAFTLIIPIILGPGLCLFKIAVLIAVGCEQRHDHDALSFGEEIALDNAEYYNPDQRSFSTRIADSILDMTSPQTTGIMPTIKGEFKINEFGETMFREEATGEWKKVTQIGSDTIEIDGKKYRK